MGGRVGAGMALERSGCVYLYMGMYTWPFWLKGFAKFSPTLHRPNSYLCHLSKAQGHVGAKGCQPSGFPSCRMIVVPGDIAQAPLRFLSRWTASEHPAPWEAWKRSHVVGLQSSSMKSSASTPGC